MSKLTPEQNTKCLEQQNKFFGGEVCDFPGAEALKRLYDVEMKNLGSGCSRCKKNAIKRKYAAKIKKVFENVKDV